MAGALKELGSKLALAAVVRIIQSSQFPLISILDLMKGLS